MIRETCSCGAEVSTKIGFTSIIDSFRKVHAACRERPPERSIPVRLDGPYVRTDPNATASPPSMPSSQEVGE